MGKLLLCGAFAFDTNDHGGQPVKSREVFWALEKKYGSERVDFIETAGWKKHPVKLLRRFFALVGRADNVVMLPAYKGVKVFAPLLIWAKTRYKIGIHYVVIGGWLPELLQCRPRLAQQLKRFDGIYVETNTMKKALEQQGVENVAVMPNFKTLHILKESELVYHTEEPLMLCTFSRVMREKGIEDAVNVVKAVNEKYGRTVYTLDIYGQVDAGQSKWFAELERDFPDYVRYMGIVPSDKSVETLKGYFALLFPTYYNGEGFAGTLIDALSAGVPVISSDWRYNNELVAEGKTGTLFASRDINGFISKLVYAAEHVDAWNRMKLYCINKAEEYRPEQAIEVLCTRL